MNNPSHAKKAQTKPNSAAASALLEDYYLWLIRTGKLTPQRRRGVVVQVQRVKVS